MRVGKRVVVVSMLFGIAITAWSRACLLPDAGAAPPQDAPGKYQGAMTCDGASCHGKKEARAEPPYLTEYVSFTGRSPEGAAYDRHSIAFKRLKDKGQDSDEHSKAIMEKLNALEGTKDAATTSERCLTCHGVSVHDYGMGKGGLAVGRVKELQGKGYKAEDGVSCDGCHGPA